MAEKVSAAKKLTEKNTKQEMLDAYQSLSKQLEEKRSMDLNTEKRVEEKVAQEAIQIAKDLPPQGIDAEIGALKAEIGRILTTISDKMSDEANRFRQVQKAVECKERELKELFAIEKSAVALAALIEAQSLKKQQFEEEMSQQREELNREINTMHEEWEKEKKAHEIEVRERDAVEKKARDRDKEAFDYAFKRDQQSIKDKLNDEKSTLEKEIARRKEEYEKQYAEREKALHEKEREFAELKLRATAFPGELENAVNSAVKNAVSRIELESKNREELSRKGFEGERNVFNARIQALELAVKDLTGRNEKLTQQSDAAYRKVQEIAEKSIEGASQAKSFAEIQKFLSDQARKSGGEKM